MIWEETLVNSFEERRSLVWPVNCGSLTLAEIIELQFCQISSAVSLIPLGIKFLKSQNSFRASVKPVLVPFTCVPPWEVGMRFT